MFAVSECNTSEEDCHALCLEACIFVCLDVLVLISVTKHAWVTGQMVWVLHYCSMALVYSSAVFNHARCSDWHSVALKSQVSMAPLLRPKHVVVCSHTFPNAAIIP